MDYCYIHPDKGDIVIKIMVDNGARSHWNCALAKKESEKWTAIETFEFISADHGVDTYTLKSDVKNIENTSLLWRVLTCSTVSGVERAKYSLFIFQDEEEVYRKVSDRKIPMCDDNKAISFRNMVAIKYHTVNHEKVDIWDVLS